MRRHEYSTIAVWRYDRGIGARADAHQRARILRAAAERMGERLRHVNVTRYALREWMVYPVNATDDAANRQEAIGNGTAEPTVRGAARFARTFAAEVFPHLYRGSYLEF